jgi:hypothetical protein
MMIRVMTSVMLYPEPDRYHKLGPGQMSQYSILRRLCFQLIFQCLSTMSDSSSPYIRMRPLIEGPSSCGPFDLLNEDALALVFDKCTIDDVGVLAMVSSVRLNFPRNKTRVLHQTVHLLLTLIFTHRNKT